MQNEDTTYIQFGRDGSTMSLDIPDPSTGTAGFDVEPQVRWVTNANNQVVGQLRGREREEITIGWDMMGAEKWHEIGRWLSTNGPLFWCRYFSHSMGEWRARQFGYTNMHCEPLVYDGDQPEIYAGCTITLFETGKV